MTNPINPPFVDLKRVGGKHWYIERFRLRDSFGESVAVVGAKTPDEAIRRLIAKEPEFARSFSIHVVDRKNNWHGRYDCEALSRIAWKLSVESYGPETKPNYGRPSGTRPIGLTQDSDPELDSSSYEDAVNCFPCDSCGQYGCDDH